MVVSTSNQNKEFKQVSFLEEASKSKSRWIEMRIYDDETYQKLLQARQSGSSESYYKPLKTISHGHYGVSGGPLFKMESVAAVGLFAVFFVAHSLRSKMVN
jgi:Leu/Phe-tRNA-protein transferase